MPLMRIVILALVCCLSLAGNSTPSPSAKAAYLTSGPTGQAGSGATSLTGSAATGSWVGSRALASVQLGSPTEAQLRGRALWLPPPAEMPSYEPAPADEEPPPAPLDPSPRFHGQPDDELLAHICSQPVKAIKPLGGGASIKFKVKFADGSEAAVKPNQTRITRYQAEVAAYRIARALRLSVVPPSCVRRFSREQLMANMPKDLRARMEEELLPDDKGEVACAVITWVPGLHALKLETQDWWRPALLRGGPIPPGKQRRMLEISTLLLFDYLILNYDRWSGGNTHEVDGHMVYIDQGAGFGPDRHHRSSRHMMHTLKWSQRFSAEIAQNLFDLDVGKLQGELADILTPDELEGLTFRIHHARDYLRSLRRAAPKDSLL
jgi:hypothetical protein